MNKMMVLVTKLIRWQRITIAALVLSLVPVGLLCYTQNLAARDAVENARRVKADNQALTAMSRNDEQIIRDMDARLHKYEVRYGEIEPQRKGEGVYIGQRTVPEIVFGDAVTPAAQEQHPQRRVETMPKALEQRVKKMVIIELEPLNLAVVLSVAHQASQNHKPDLGLVVLAGR